MTTKNELAPRTGGAGSRSLNEPSIATESSEPVTRVLERLQELGREPRRAGTQWTARCPAHDDRNPSLSVSRGEDGRALLHCFAGCDPAEVCGALGFELQDLFSPAAAETNGRVRRSSPELPAKPHARPAPQTFTSRDELIRHLQRGGPHAATQEWVYHYHDGHEAFRVLRLDAGGRKSYRPVYQSGGNWVVGDPPGLLPLYNLPAVMASNEVLLVEGEKCADVAARLGFVATTSAHGSQAAAKTDWSPLAGKRVTILPDADDAGEQYASDVTARLRELKPPVQARLLRLPGLAEGEDIADWADQRSGQTDDVITAELRDLLNKAEPAPLPDPTQPRLLTRRASEIEPVEISWLVKDLIPLGKLTLLCGDPGLGKSLLTGELAARVSRGEPLIGSSARCPQGHTLIISAEDDPADTIRPRLGIAGADLDRVSILAGVFHGSEDHLPGVWDLSRTDLLAKWVLDRPDLRLVILDPLSAYLAGADAHRDAEVRAMIHQLTALAAERGFAVVCVSHLNKRTSASAIYRAIGSITFVAAARSVLLVAADPLEDDRRLLVQTKRNLSAAAPSLAFRIENGPRLDWESQPAEVDLESLLGTASSSDSTQGARRKAADWLETQLAAGPVLASEIFRAAKREGYCERTLRRARDAIGAISEQPGFGRQSIVWRLPDNA